MIQRTILAGAGDHYVRLTSRRGNHSYPDAVAGFYGAFVESRDAGLEISNGEFSVLLETARAAAPVSPDDRALGAKQFSAPAHHIRRRFPGFLEAERVDVLIMPMGAYELQNPRSATQAVMHTSRTLHGPGQYPETTRWGTWINGYRAEAAAQASAREARK